MDTSIRIKPFVESFVNGESHPFKIINQQSVNDIERIEAPDGIGMEVRSLGWDHYLVIGDKEQGLPDYDLWEGRRFKQIRTIDEMMWEERRIKYAEGGYPFYHLNRWRKKEVLGYLCIGVRWDGDAKKREWRCGRGIRFPKHAVAVKKLILDVGKNYVTWEKPREHGQKAIKLSGYQGHRYIVAAFSASEGRAVEVTERICFSTPISCHFDYPEEFWGTEIWLAYAYLPSTETIKNKWEKGAG